MIGNIFLVFAIFGNSSVYSLPYVIFVLYIYYITILQYYTRLTLTSFKLTFFLALRIVIFLIISLIIIYIWILSSNKITLTIFITDLISYLTIALAGLFGSYFAEITARTNFWSLFVSFRKQLALTACVDLLYSVRNKRNNKGVSSIKIPDTPLSTSFIIKELNLNKHNLNVIEHNPKSSCNSPLKSLIYSDSSRLKINDDMPRDIEVPTLNTPTKDNLLLGGKNTFSLDLNLGTPRNKSPHKSPQNNLLINSYSRRITGNNPILSPNQRNLANMLSVPVTPSKPNHARHYTTDMNFNKRILAFFNSENLATNDSSNPVKATSISPSSVSKLDATHTDVSNCGVKKSFFFNDSIADFHINQNSIVNADIEDSPAPLRQPSPFSNVIRVAEPRLSLSSVPILSSESKNLCISVTPDGKSPFDMHTPFALSMAKESKESTTLHSKNSGLESINKNSSKSEHKRAKSCTSSKLSSALPGCIASQQGSDADRDSVRSLKKYPSASIIRKAISTPTTDQKLPSKTALLRPKILSVVKQIRFRKRLEIYEHQLFEIIDFKLQFLDPDLEDGFSLIHLEQNTGRVLALMSLFIFSLLLGAILDWNIAPFDLFWPNFVGLRFGLMIPSLLISIFSTYFLKSRYILHQVILGSSILATGTAYSIQVYMLPEYNQY